MCLPVKWVNFYNKCALGAVGNLSGLNVYSLKSLAETCYSVSSGFYRYWKFGSCFKDFSSAKYVIVVWYTMLLKRESK